MKTEMFTVFRLELKDGSGIYRGSKGNIWNQITDSHVDLIRHPKPQNDSKLEYDEYFDSEYFFGFETIAQYEEWFSNDEWRSKFSEHELVLSTYDVEKEFIRLGKKQLIFRKDKAALREQSDPFTYDLLNK